VSDSGTDTATRPGPEAPAPRNSVLWIVIGVLAVLSAVIAALVIFSNAEAPAKKPEAAAAVRADDESLHVGSSDAPTKVVVYEDFASPQSREFEIASRDFLRIEAARGKVQVEYRPFAVGDDGYSTDALQAWAGVLGAGTPNQALAYHDVLFDRQPSTGSPTPSELVTWAEDKGISSQGVHAAMAQPDDALAAAAARAAQAAGATRPPMVVLGGTPLTADSPTGLADALQRRILELER
jgi:protein-disulfide isomerase